MLLTENICKVLRDLFTHSSTKENAIKRLKNLCEKYNTNLHIIEWDFKDETTQQIDETYYLIISN